MSENENKKSKLTSILAIVGFIVIIAIGIWGAINAVRLAPQVFSTLASPFDRVSDEIDIRVPSSSINSNTPFELSWKHGGKDGVYAFSYRCRPGLQFQVPQPDGTYLPINCESPYNIQSSNNSFRLIPISSMNRFLDVPFVIAYINKEGEIAAEGSSMITVVNQSAPESPDTVSLGNLGSTGPEPSQPTSPTPSTPYPVTPNLSIPTTPTNLPDLSVRILGVGSINPNTRTFVPQSTLNASDIGAVRFEIINSGNKASGVWGFSASLPTNPSFKYTSERQRSLNPGDRIEYTIQFDQLVRGTNTFTVHADAADEIKEVSEANNIATQAIAVE
ncbi:hypothetical protein COU13_00985 [Candidatus Kaiserbacteria bacterium CG10_big_fil_rev_8_21_14_0_10_43_70]|uniref:CARDB domain-containing protein n=1 Tax=Candidatus Kaiserbacteria bacterium CG10_big_fil_rev_8_21_14_0_10_43_70 TaxID=1974605 RepID=A0A2H0UL80_9BACT|nr:MAG: hypothetical protein COU13_00985 [Candidatus Kaiserbacteria bacterium CG10_big_fil_rev_8_21_14_0_10_43_70]